jgi:hypothetical protein
MEGAMSWARGIYPFPLSSYVAKELRVEFPNRQISKKHGGFINKDEGSSNKNEVVKMTRYVV